ncbi:hypothetical protein OVY01_01515 [Robbsia sp. Bb-Pol-6]|uniref:Neutral/alkaline non-lysosomal ceramidase N-terminal domain-containing protein n=1 Tax=Robbsia betulipollinis TaxID=2981849 RepID=A0ABT3ZIZ5_9BURK|nr:hypothetical protein [Robbsia betulipollinis]MCY0385940.1 hypothetical protein [Robbsia betulipollinis]
MRSRRNFLFSALSVGAAALTSPAISKGAIGKTAPRLQAGAGRADVVFPASLYPVDGFTGSHDPLAVRVLLLDDGATRIGIVVVDLTSIAEDMITSMKAVLTELAGVPADQAIVCASHSFATPHVFTGAHVPPGTDTARTAIMQRAFDTAIRSAAAQAVSGLVPARSGFGSGKSPIGVNRDVATPHGWWLGANDAGFADPTLGVVRIDGRDGKPLAILMNVAVQPSVMDGSQLAAGGKLISADLAGAAARYVEARHPGAVALFLVGAAGDQSPYLQANRHVVHHDGSVGRVDIHEAGFAVLDLLGERLGTDIANIADGIRTQAGAQVTIARDSIPVNGLDFSPRNAPTGPVPAFTYRHGAAAKVPIVVIRLGDIALVGMAPELAASVGTRIRAGSPYADTLVATMVDGAAKYLPDAQSYDRFTYEARSSPYAQGAAETVADGIVDTLKRMQEGDTAG